MEYTDTVRVCIRHTQRFFLSSVGTHTCGWGTVLPGTMLAEVLTDPEDPNELDVIVGPNPTTDILRIGGQVIDTQMLTLTLMTSQGQVVWRRQSAVQNGFVETIYLGGQPAGVYLLKAEAEGKRRVIRIVKQ